MTAQANWSDGDVLTMVEATHLTGGQQSKFREDWCFALGLLILALDRDGADRARELASARHAMRELAVRIVEAEAARTVSDAWTGGGPPALNPDEAKEVEWAMRRMVRRSGANSPMSVRARVAMQAVHDHAWLRRQLEGLGREDG